MLDANVVAELLCLRAACEMVVFAEERLRLELGLTWLIQYCRKLIAATLELRVVLLNLSLAEVSGAHQSETVH